MRARLPRIPLWLLSTYGCGPHAEELAGDLIEEYHSGRSSRWLWCQAVVGVVSTFGAELRGNLVLTGRVGIVCAAITLLGGEIVGFVFDSVNDMYCGVHVGCDPMRFRDRGLFNDNGTPMLVLREGVSKSVIFTWSLWFVTYAFFGWVVKRLHPASHRGAIISCACGLLIWSGWAIARQALFAAQLDNVVHPIHGVMFDIADRAQAVLAQTTPQVAGFLMVGLSRTAARRTTP